VRPAEQEWIDASMDWFLVEFGLARLDGAVVLPTDDHFPGDYSGSRDDVRRVLEMLCAHVEVDPATVDLEHDEDDGTPLLEMLVPIEGRSSFAAGHYRRRDGRSVIGIRDSQAARPTALVATIAHELGHVKLLGEGRIGPGRQDGEPLTDLLTVYLGLGIFSANAAFDFYRGNSYTKTSRLGYLTEPMWGYGLARYAWLRGESDPAWARYLDTNPRTFLKRGLRYLDATTSG
jgi:hypothetical protein